MFITTCGKSHLLHLLKLMLTNLEVNLKIWKGILFFQTFLETEKAKN